MSALPVLNLYHVYAQDKPGAQRAKHKAQHLTQNTPHMQSGFIRKYRSTQVHFTRALWNVYDCLRCPSDDDIFDV